MSRFTQWLARGWHRHWPAGSVLRSWSGTEARSGQPLTVLVSGSRWNRIYLSSLLYSTAPTETNLGWRRVRTLFGAANGLNREASLQWVAVSPGQFQEFASVNQLFIPTWLRGEIQLPLPEPLLKRETLKTDLRKIRQQEFGYEIARSGAAFREFFHEMNRPYVRAAHGEAAFTDWLGHHRRWLIDYEILFVHRRREPAQRLAGIVITYEKTGPRLWTLGVRAGHFDEVQNGIIGALYHFSFERVQARGFTTLRTGNSRAFLNDGVLRFKQKLANRIIEIYPVGWALKIFRLDAPTRNFLATHPFAIQTGGDIWAVVFAETPLSVAAVERWLKAYRHLGFRGLRLYTLDEAETFTAAQLPPELADVVQIRAAKELLAD